MPIPSEGDLTLRHVAVDGPIGVGKTSLCEMLTRRFHGTKILEEIWDGAEAQETLKIDRYAHLVGGCRMGFGSDDSVVDSSHRAWEVPNLLIADGSVFPTQGAANPALVIMALADRLAELLKRKQL